MRQKGRYEGAMKMHLEALELSQRTGDKHLEANSYGFIGITYLDLESYDNAFYNLRQAIDMREHLNDNGADVVFMIFLAQAYNETGQVDSAFYALAEAKEMLRHSQTRQVDVLRRNGRIRDINVGDAFLLKKNLDSALFYYRVALDSALQYRSYAPNHVSLASRKLASVLMEKNFADSALHFARYAYSVLRNTNVYPRILEASSLLTQLHRKNGTLDSALYYHDITIALNDSLYGKDKSNALQLLLLQEQTRHEESLRNEERSKSSQRLIGMVSITLVILVASIQLFRNNRIKQKTNAALQQTLKELRSTQSQLVQSEKMASLGELTAGIAHEIQNPLNFVNNFSEVSNELFDEMKSELASGNIASAMELAENIKQNLEKINQHGKRADAIVKSMLQHSRSSSGQKELTDINALCDECLRLTYHGYRAKEKSFNVKLNANFDRTLPEINVVRQDIGRVLLNLINNAFYAVNETSRDTDDAKYEPTVAVSTKNNGTGIEIIVSDNGPGIPEKLKEKIFQPFFTTKPAGQGTGLGLSLAYDIITKAHGGELKVETTEGAGSDFIILLPLSKNT
jgi:signal transduction histidine kinase